MKQVVQDQSAGRIEVVEVPPPLLQAQGVVVALEASVISSGTERSKIEIAERSLVGKARSRPDLVRKVVDQARRDGLRETIDLVRDRLAMPQPLGYSAAGTVLQVGPEAPSFQVGSLVACGGAGFANHAEMVYVPGNLCAAVPPGVVAEQAAFGTVGSIALHGLRQATLEQGDLVVISGLGLIGQLAVRLALAYGHPVVGVDPSEQARTEVEALGISAYPPDHSALTRIGADAVLLTAATSSSAPITAAPTWCRDRGTVVVVGDVGLELQRGPYYDREVDIRFSRSYGPGRYDPDYEERGRDYPIGYVRWTEGRNLAEILRLIADGRLRVDDLVAGRYRLEDAPAAYERLARGERVRALVLTYDRPSPGHVRTAQPTAVGSLQAGAGKRLRVGVCGAGNFARKTLLPGLEATGRVSWATIATASGLTAEHVRRTKGFISAVADPGEVIVDPNADAVLIATRHDSHATLVGLAARSGKFVFVEKPLAISRSELVTLCDLPGTERVVTGFNRRWSPAALGAALQMRGRSGPALVQIRVNAGALPPGHWADRPEQGGRLVGELCHFIDLACFLVGYTVSTVAATGGGRRAPLVEDNAQVLLSFVDGSSAVLSYFSVGSNALPKENVEVHWDGMSVSVDDFRVWRSYGRRARSHRSRHQDKGHRRLLSEFVRFGLEGGKSPVSFDQAVHVTDVSFAVIEALETGRPARPSMAMSWI